MNDTQSQTESLLDIVRGIDSQSIMLPEFQRDFRWELEQTYDLFDSLVREIFIGTLIHPVASDYKLRLRDMIEIGVVNTGDKIYIRKHPEMPAFIVDADTVEFNGDRIPINSWGQRVTGWSSINIYEHAVLERTGQLLEVFRTFTGSAN